jgi:hypothetical protein
VTVGYAGIVPPCLSSPSLLVTREKGAPFIGIPVFPSRLFRHTSVYANRDRIPEAGGANAVAVAFAPEELFAPETGEECVI